MSLLLLLFLLFTYYLPFESSSAYVLITERLAAYLWSNCVFIFSPVQFVCFSCVSPWWRNVGCSHGNLSTMLWLFKVLQRKDNCVIWPQKCFIFPGKNSTMLEIPWHQASTNTNKQTKCFCYLFYFNNKSEKGRNLIMCFWISLLYSTLPPLYNLFS